MWSDKYFDRITPELINEFTKNHPNEFLMAHLNGAMFGKMYGAGTYEGCLKSPNTQTILRDYCEEIAAFLDLPLCTLLHQILQPKCKDCKHFKIKTAIIPYRLLVAHPLSYERIDHADFDDECPYKKAQLPILVAHLTGNYCPPLGCDCWEPKSKGDTNV